MGSTTIRGSNETHRRLKEMANRQDRAILDNLETRFGDLPEDLNARVAEIEDLDRLVELRREAIDCPDQDAFLEQLEG